MSNTEITLYVLLYYVLSKGITYILFAIILAKSELKKEITREAAKEKAQSAFFGLLVPVIGDILVVFISFVFIADKLHKPKYKENNE